jgi:hypothetical protein
MEGLRKEQKTGPSKCPQHPSIPSVPPTSCATPRNWHCLATLWAFLGLP